MHVVPIETESDWLSIAADLDAGDHEIDSPHHDWRWIRSCWRHEPQVENLHALRHLRTGRPPITAFFQAHGRSFWQGPRDLRGVENEVMIARPCFGGDERSFFSALLDERHVVARCLGVDQLRLGKLGSSSAALLEELCESRGIPADLRRTDGCSVVHLEDDLDEARARKGRKARYNIRRSRRRLGALHERGCHLFRLRCEASDHPMMGPAMEDALRLLADSHQMEKATEATWTLGGRLAHLTEQMRVWAERGCLDLCLLLVGSRPVATQVNVLADGRLWVVHMAYDRSLAGLSPGRVLFDLQLEDGHRRGDRRWVLGGGGGDWKSYWANEEESVWQVTLPLSISLDRIRRLVRLIRRSRRESSPWNGKRRSA